MKPPSMDVQKIIRTSSNPEQSSGQLNSLEKEIQVSSHQRRNAYHSIHVQRISQSSPRTQKSDQSLMNERNRRFSSIYVRKLLRLSRYPDNSVQPFNKIKKRSQSLIYRKTILHPAIHVQRINRSPSYQERIITPTSYQCHTHISRADCNSIIQVTRFTL